MTYAVIKTGGKQYKVAEGDRLVIEKLEGETGDVVALDQVLMIGGDNPVVGSPLVEGAQVMAELLEIRKGKKVKVFKKRRRQNYRRTKGHRQWEALISVSEIVMPGTKPKTKASAKPKPAAKAEAPEAAAAPAKTAAPKKAETAAPKPASQAKTEAKPKAAAADDLTALTGVGPALAKKLNEAGVSSFAQIAAWTDADIAKLEDAIPGLGAKAEKGGWIAAAKEQSGS